ncbi:MAG: hypothetical protein NT120_03100 [Candidatus Aenigmarchaeota archaeon]|nr:hypothetical protein [Candidatus Aenigmarchaeota archaeon]
MPSRSYEIKSTKEFDELSPSQRLGYLKSLEDSMFQEICTLALKPESSVSSADTYLANKQYESLMTLVEYAKLDGDSSVSQRAKILDIRIMLFNKFALKIEE